MTERTSTERWLELGTAVLLALATVATAWAAYQAREWTGQQSTGYSQATAARIAENRAAALASRQVQIDLATFIQWLDADRLHRTELADFYRTRFRDEFKPAFAAWIATRPFVNPDAPPTPFAMSEYRLKATADAEQLEATAAAASERAKDANQRADNFMLAVVLFATSLFFFGLSAKLTAPRSREVMLGIGCVVFLAGAIWVATLPVQVTT
jgi:hypothetical protein